MRRPPAPVQPLVWRRRRESSVEACSQSRAPLLHGLPKPFGAARRRQLRATRRCGYTLRRGREGALLGPGLERAPHALAMPPAVVVSIGSEASRHVLGLAPLKRFTIEGRTGRKLTIVRTADGSLSAIDFHCFHHGGELGNGQLADIEDVGTVLQCPSHGYVVDVRTGERLVRHDGAGSSDVPCWQRHAVVQRTHEVTVDDQGSVFIHLRDSTGVALPSDAYNIPNAAPAARTIGSGSNLAFACRKSRAVEAVARANCAKAAAASTHAPPPPAAAAAAAPPRPPPIFAPWPTAAALPATPPAVPISTPPAVPISPVSPHSPWPTHAAVHAAAAAAATPATSAAPPLADTSLRSPPPTMKQTTLDGLFGAAAARARPEPQPQPDAMDTS